MKQRCLFSHTFRCQEYIVAVTFVDVRNTIGEMIIVILEKR